MINNKRIKYKKIDENVISTLCIKIFMKFKNNRNYFKIIINKIYIIIEFFCDIIIKIEMMKFN